MTMGATTATFIDTCFNRRGIFAAPAEVRTTRR
jgi:hypothetical protein